MAKNIYALTIMGDIYIVSYDNMIARLVYLKGGPNLNIYSQTICAYINQELERIRQTEDELRNTLKELQNVILNSTMENMINNIYSVFQSINTNELMQYQNQILVSDEYEDSGMSKGGKQKVLSNGKSLLDKDAFIDALTLALIVEMTGLIAAAYIILNLI